jgi:hypothetical protein
MKWSMWCTGNMAVIYTRLLRFWASQCLMCIPDIRQQRVNMKCHMVPHLTNYLWFYIVTLSLSDCRIDKFHLNLEFLPIHIPLINSVTYLNVLLHNQQLNYLDQISWRGWGFPDCPWDPPSLLHNGYWVSSLRLKQLRHGVDHPPHLVPRLKKEYS